MNKHAGLTVRPSNVNMCVHARVFLCRIQIFQSKYRCIISNVYRYIVVSHRDGVNPILQNAEQQER